MSQAVRIQKIYFCYYVLISSLKFNLSYGNLINEVHSYGEFLLRFGSRRK